MAQDRSPSLQNTSALESAFQSIAQSVAASIVDALAEPLRQEIESRVSNIIADATKDIHSRIALAISQIQPINIPINLLSQPVPSLVHGGSLQALAPAAVPGPETRSLPQASAPKSVEAAKAAETALFLQEQEEAAASAPAPALKPAQPLTRAGGSQNEFALAKREKERTPKKSRKNFEATIVGLLPGQAHLIKNDFKFAKLSFVSSDARNNSQLVSLSKSKNAVIFMTDFIRHAAVDSVRAANGNWVYVTGGMSSLREKLQELYQQHQTQANLLQAA